MARGKSRKEKPDKDELKKKMSRKAFEAGLDNLQIERGRLLKWVVHKGLKAVVVFEGRDAADKGVPDKRTFTHTVPEHFSLGVFDASSSKDPCGVRELQSYMQRKSRHFARHSLVRVLHAPRFAAPRTSSATGVSGSRSTA